MIFLYSLIEKIQTRSPQSEYALNDFALNIMAIREKREDLRAMPDKIINLQNGLNTAFINGTFQSNLAYRPQFIYNDNLRM